MKNKQLLHPIFHVLISPIVLEFGGNIAIGVGLYIYKGGEAPDAILADDVGVLVLIYLKEDDLFLFLGIIFLLHKVHQLIPLRLEPVAVGALLHEDVNDYVLVVVSRFVA